MADNYNLSVAASELNSAITKANAAAPRSTTYTRAQVDTALAAKLNTADMDDALSSTSTNPVQNKVVQAAVAHLADAGAKNFIKNTAPYGDLVKTNITFTHNDDDTYTVNATSANAANTDLYVAADMPIKAGSYVISGCPEGGNNTDTFKIQVTGVGYDLGNGFTFTIAQDTTISVYIRIWAGYIPENLVFKPMICTVEEWSASKEYVPYTPTLAELYQMVKGIKSMQGGS